ncbi:hypothetical protein EG68_07413 [Paragonimus skrjabini miyazakii]|uniref:Uncharacterized protein n=1 Tax=Paragonimus skrjabini miyazakii TaxID=59628 RepID=A0A8S9YS67_9TREM|nr:hypothetical protein EG68_07413 [Paragonimus skrjabini miyazakii]
MLHCLEETLTSINYDGNSFVLCKTNLSIMTCSLNIQKHAHFTKYKFFESNLRGMNPCTILDLQNSFIQSHPTNDTVSCFICNGGLVWVWKSIFASFFNRARHLPTEILLLKLIKKFGYLPTTSETRIINLHRMSLYKMNNTRLN